MNILKQTLYYSTFTHRLGKLGLLINDLVVIDAVDTNAVVLMAQKAYKIDGMLAIK